jgi:hypothetical protein
MYTIEQLKYPIGKYHPLVSISESDTAAAFKQIGELPERLKAAVFNLNDDQLDTSYREGGWTLRQVVHHLADSHANAYVRFKLALTEKKPNVWPLSGVEMGRLFTY